MDEGWGESKRGFRNSPATQHLIGWMHQLEEFTHKAVARRDTHAATAALGTMSAIGIHYAEVRRDSIVLVPEFAGFMPIGVSDVADVLNPIYECVRSVRQDAARQPDEAVVIACIRQLGRMAAHFMTIVHTRDEFWATAPFAYSPIFYIKVCATEATKAKMDDALLAAVRATKPIYEKISDKVQTLEAETTAMDCLFEIALSGYIRSSHVPADEAVKMMLAAAQHELKVRDFDHNKSLRTVLQHIAFLVPFEAKADKARHSIMQLRVFSPYAPKSGLVALLVEEARKIRPHERDWVDPFHDFEDVAKEIVHHYREVADKVSFEGVMLQRWVVGSALDCADLQVALLESPPQGSWDFLDTVENRLTWFIHTPSFFFKETSSFPSHHAENAAERLACIGMRLLRLRRLEAAKACAKAIASIGHKAAKATGARSYEVADIFDKIEMLARAADALGNTSLAKECRGLEKRNEIVGKLPEYAEAICNRTECLDESLAEYSHQGHSLPDDPVPLLRRILIQAEALKVHRRAIIKLLLNRSIGEAARGAYSGPQPGRQRTT